MVSFVQSPGPPPYSETLRDRWVALGLALVCIASLFFWVHPWYDPTNDGSMYIATARALAAGEGYTYLGEAFRIRPPGFSLLLAPFAAAGGPDFLVLNAFVSLFGVLLVVALFFFSTQRIGTWLSVCVCLCVWTNPGFQRLCNQVMSDVPGLALAFLCLLYERRLKTRTAFSGGGWKRQLAFGAAIGVVAHIRSSALLILPAILVARLIRRWILMRAAGDPEPWNRWLAANALLVVGAFSLIAPWNVRNNLAAPEPPADQTRLYDYGTGMWHEDMGDPGSRKLGLGEIAGRFSRRSVQIGSSLGNRLIKTSERTWQSDTWALFFIACSAMVLVRRREAPELFVFASLVVVSFYFGFAPRLMLPCFVLGLVAGAEVLQAVARILLRPGWADGLIALLLLALACMDFQPRKGWKNIQERHETFAAVSDEIQRRAPDAVLGAYRAWDLAVHLNRAVYGFEQAQRREGRPNACEGIIDKYGIDTVVLVPLGLPALLLPEHTRLETYIENRYGPAPDPLKLIRVRP